MAKGPLRLVLHGGATAGAHNTGGLHAAAAAAHAAHAAGASVLDAVVEACRVLEDDGRYNAGCGSQLRMDGRTVEMDAACMTGDGKMGAVVCVTDVRNPILAARRVHDTPHVSLVGEGATSFARLLGMPPRAGPSPAAVRGAAEARRALQRRGFALETGWRLEHILAHWNYAGPVPPELQGSDTVGVVGTDGTAFAVAASTGGLSITLRGRASDVGMPGAGLFAGPAGAVACTGRGEFLAQTLLSHRIYASMATGMAAQQAIDEAMGTVPEDTQVGAIALDAHGVGAAANCGMPWVATPG